MYVSWYQDTFFQWIECWLPKYNFVLHTCTLNPSSSFVVTFTSSSNNLLLFGLDNRRSWSLAWWALGPWQELEAFFASCQWWWQTTASKLIPVDIKAAGRCRSSCHQDIRGSASRIHRFNGKNSFSKPTTASSISPCKCMVLCTFAVLGAWSSKWGGMLASSFAISNYPVQSHLGTWVQQLSLGPQFWFVRKCLLYHLWEAELEEEMYTTTGWDYEASHCSNAQFWYEIVHTSVWSRINFCFRAWEQLFQIVNTQILPLNRILLHFMGHIVLLQL